MTDSNQIIKDSQTEKHESNDGIGQLIGLCLAATLLLFFCALAMSLGDYFDYLKEIDSNAYNFHAKQYEIEFLRKELSRLETSCKGKG